MAATNSNCEFKLDGRQCQPSAKTKPTESSAVAIPVEVLSASGRWVAGFELLATNPDGTVTIRSNHTGKTRRLWPDQWRDPLEVVALATNRMEMA